MAINSSSTAVLSSTNRTTSSKDGFFGWVRSGAAQVGETLSGSFSTYASTVARDILPNWTAKQLGLQSYDQLQRSTFDWGQAPLRADVMQAADAPAGKATVGIGNVQFTPSSLLIMGGIFIATVVVLKRL